MPAMISVLTRIDPLRVSVARDQSMTSTPVYLGTGADVVAMTRTEARSLASALLAAAAFAARTLRRPADVDDYLREMDR